MMSNRLRNFVLFICLLTVGATFADTFDSPDEERWYSELPPVDVEAQAERSEWHRDFVTYLLQQDDLRLKSLGLADHVSNAFYVSYQPLNEWLGKDSVKSSFSQRLVKDDKLLNKALLDLLKAAELGGSVNFRLAGICQSKRFRPACLEHDYLQKAMQRDPGNVELFAFLPKSKLIPTDKNISAELSAQLSKTTYAKAYYGYDTMALKQAAMSFQLIKPMPETEGDFADGLPESLMKGVEAERYADILARNSAALQINYVVFGFVLQSASSFNHMTFIKLCDTEENLELCLHISDLFLASKSAGAQGLGLGLRLSLYGNARLYEQYKTAASDQVDWIRSLSCIGGLLAGNSTLQYLLPDYHNALLSNIELVGEMPAFKLAAQSLHAAMIREGLSPDFNPYACSGQALANYVPRNHPTDYPEMLQKLLAEYGTY